MNSRRLSIFASVQDDIMEQTFFEGLEPCYSVTLSILMEDFDIMKLFENFTVI